MKIAGELGMEDIVRRLLVSCPQSPGALQLGISEAPSQLQCIRQVLSLREE